MAPSNALFHENLPVVAPDSIGLPKNFYLKFTKMVGWTRNSSIVGSQTTLSKKFFHFVWLCYLLVMVHTDMYGLANFA